MRTQALAFPEAYEEMPWGHHAIKVNGKAFLFLSAEAGGLSLSTKLPGSGAVALALPLATPTAYGLAKSGWVTAEFGPKAKVPVALLETWIEESYRAIAPKRLLKALDPATPQPAKPPKRKKAAAKRRG